MAVTTRASKVTAKALKEQYHAFMDLLNYGADWVKELKVSGEVYKGRELIVPIRTEKVQPGAFMGENDPLQTPVSANSTFLSFDVVLYNARIAVTWMAQDFDDGSVVKLSDDMEAWIDSNNENLEYAAIFGNAVRGIICEFPGTAGVPIAIATAFNDNLGAAGANRSAVQELDYDGDFRCFRALGSTSPDPTADESMDCYPLVATSPAIGTPSTWVPITLRCLDDLRLVESGHGITAGGGAGSFGFFVVATDELNSTITIVAVDSAAALSSFHLQGLMPVGNGIGVELGTTTTLGARTIGNTLCWTNHASKEMFGILHNLFAGTFGTKTRAATASTDPLKALRSRGYIASVAAGGGRTALAGARVIRLLDIVRARNSKAPQKLYANPLFNSIYIAAMTSAFNFNVESSGAQHKSDLVNTGTRLAGYTINEMRRLPRGMLLFVTPEQWKICTPKKGGVGGVPMLRFRVQGKNRDSDTYPHTTTTIWGVFQQICFTPRSAAVLSGLDIVNELLD